MYFIYLRFVRYFILNIPFLLQFATFKVAIADCKGIYLPKPRSKSKRRGIPYLRGLPKSRRIGEIASNINSYNGFIREVILPAINTEAFGNDTGETFLDLIKTVFLQPRVPRLSFGSVHPWSITDEFINYYHSNNDREWMVKYFHIPLQSGSNRILTLMKRCHTREDMMNRVKRLYEVNPYTFIATDIIIGFLEETDEDFKDTYDFLEQSPIHKFHVFRYSKRAMTAGFYIGKRLGEPSVEIKKRDQNCFENFQKRNMLNFNKNSLVIKVRHFF